MPEASASFGNGRDHAQFQVRTTRHGELSNRAKATQLARGTAGPEASLPSATASPDRDSRAAVYASDAPSDEKPRSEGSRGCPNPIPRPPPGLQSPSEARPKGSSSNPTPENRARLGATKPQPDPGAGLKPRCRTPPGEARAPEGLAAALGLRTVVGLARFILSPTPRRSSLPTPQRGEDQRHSGVRRSPIHSDPPSGAGAPGEWPAPPRAATPEAAARPRLGPGQGLRRRQPQPHQLWLSASVPNHRHSRSGTGTALRAPLPEHPEAKQRGGGGGGRGSAARPEGPRPLSGACSALRRQEVGRASEPLVSTWRGGPGHPLLQVRLTLLSDVPKDTARKGGLGS